jgi:hypothetical protein
MRNKPRAKVICPFLLGQPERYKVSNWISAASETAFIYKQSHIAAWFLWQ